MSLRWQMNERTQNIFLARAYVESRVWQNNHFAITVKKWMNGRRTSFSRAHMSSRVFDKRIILWILIVLLIAMCCCCSYCLCCSNKIKLPYCMIIPQSTTLSSNVLNYPTLNVKLNSHSSVQLSFTSYHHMPLLGAVLVYGVPMKHNSPTGWW